MEPSYQLNSRLDGFRKESGILDKRKISYPAGNRTTILRLSSLRPSHSTDYTSPVFCHRLNYFNHSFKYIYLSVSFRRSFIPTNLVLNLLLPIFCFCDLFPHSGYLFYQVLYIYVYMHIHAHTYVNKYVVHFFTSYFPVSIYCLFPSEAKKYFIFLTFRVSPLGII
jgi:hypothetical protein